MRKSKRIDYLNMRKKRKMDYRNRPMNKSQSIFKKISKIIILLLINVVVFIPLFAEKYVNFKRDEWETDRNFYGKEIHLNDMKVTKNKTKTITFEPKNIKKEKTNGKIKYILKSSSNRHYTITGYANEEVYNKYIADCDKFTMYQKVCNVVYQSTNGRMDAEIESNTLYVTPKKFSKDELTNIKKSVWKQIQDKVFINGKYADKQEYGIKDYKGQTVISNYMYFDKKLKTNAYIHGKTFVKPGKYDSLYPDAEYYVKDANTKMGLKLKLLNYAVKTYRSNDYLVLVYFAESLLIAIVLALVAYIHVCENGKKESDCAKNDENIC